jgi:signal transduction histidine kinase
MSLDPRVIRTEPHAEIGALLLRDTGLLIQRWARRSAEEQPHARRVHHEALLDHLPALLEALGRSLQAVDDADHPEHLRPARTHGAQRWQTGWSLPEVVHDYQILRLVLFDYLEEVLDRPLEYREIMAIGLALDEAIHSSIAQFTAEHERQRQEIEDTLRTADRNKNEFLATLAHELRNPLAPLRNGIELLRHLPTDDPTLTQIRDLFERQVLQLTRLVDDLLDVARIAQGKLRLLPERVELHTILQRAVQMSEPLMTALSHHLDVQVPAGPLWLEADPARLVQVFANLLINAAKYTDPGGRIHLSAAADADRVVVRLRDNGVGIEPELLPRIFDLFTQAEEARDRSQGGLGIGLSLVRQLIELSSGTITAHSDGPGQGSAFVVTLPLSPSVPPPPADPA